MVKEIALTKGKFALVDDEDYEWLTQWKWYCGTVGYAIRTQHISGYGKNQKRKLILMHRLIAGTPQGMQTDHINGNGLDNRRSNLRICTKNENAYNRGSNKVATSKYKGVCWDKRAGKWLAQIKRGSSPKFLGYFSSEIEAAKIYNLAAMEIHGEFLKLNDIHCGDIL